MSGIGFSELIVLFVIGLLILGPERLPRVATQIGRWVGRARRTANQLRYQLEREIALADIEAKKKDAKAAPKDSGAAAGQAETARPKDAAAAPAPGGADSEAASADPKPAEAGDATEDA